MSDIKDRFQKDTGRFESDTALLRRLADTQPRWLEAGGIEAGAKDVIKQTMRTDWPVPTTKISRGELPPVVSLPVITTPTTSLTASTTRHPFKVYQSRDNSEPPYPILKVFPGTISNIMPTLANEKLDKLDSASGNHPWFYPPEDDFTFYLRCYVEELDAGQHFRIAVTEARVIGSNEDAVQEDKRDEDGNPDEDGAIPALTMFWEGVDDAEKAQRLKGHFYIKIADLDMDTDDEGNIVVRGITQALATNLLSFAVAGDEVIVLM